MLFYFSIPFIINAGPTLIVNLCNAARVKKQRAVYCPLEKLAYLQVHVYTFFTWACKIMYCSEYDYIERLSIHVSFSNYTKTWLKSL